MSDEIINPAHYTAGRDYQPWDVIADWQLDYYTGNALKYIARAGRKNDEIEDLQKAIRYLEKKIAILQADKPAGQSVIFPVCTRCGRELGPFASAPYICSACSYVNRPLLRE